MISMEGDEAEARIVSREIAIPSDGGAADRADTPVVLGGAAGGVVVDEERQPSRR